MLQKSWRAALPAVAALAAAIGMVAAAGASAQATDAAKIARGKYVARVGGCNDCHTPGYTAQSGEVDEKLWLTGDKFGWRGPWGTTYAPNLRLYFVKMSEDQWVAAARNLKTRPPMPWFNLREFSDTDLRSLYAYARALGPAGEPAPAYLPPDKEPPPPYAQFPSPPPAKK